MLIPPKAAFPKKPFKKRLAKKREKFSFSQGFFFQQEKWLKIASAIFFFPRLFSRKKKGFCFVEQNKFSQGFFL